MTDYDKEILRHLSGEDVPGLCWGAAMSEAIGYLRRNGYAKHIMGVYTITDKGREALSRS